MEWFEEWFGPDYDLVYGHRDESDAVKTVDAVLKFLAPEKTSFIIDICCGNGRHSGILAKKGFRVTGIDLSQHLLKKAVENRSSDKQYPVYVLGDMRRLPFRSESFDIALNLFTSFGYFSDIENAEFLVEMGSILKKGGKFFIDYLNPECVLCNLVPCSERNIGKVCISEKRKYDSRSKRLEKTILLKKEGNEKIFKESVRMYDLGEMKSMLGNAGLYPDNILGSTEGCEFSESSKRMIIFGRKK